ncbi:MAG TPA: HAD-IIIC family phosphatase [Acidobacteriaceae bacterium]|jgi:FkbH-like protein
MQLAAALLPSLAGWDKFPEAESTDPEARRSFIETDLLVFSDYLSLYFKNQDPTYRDLYIGEKLKQSYDPRDSAEQGLARRREILEKDRAALQQYLTPLLTPDEFDLLDEFLGEVARVVAGEATRQVRVLFVGDCLHLDVVAFLAAPLLEQGLRLESTFATSKTIPELLRYLRGLEARTFDVVFFSPFSYEFHLEYSQLRFLRSAPISSKKLNTMLTGTKADTLSVMRLLGSLFEAPIFVHNSAGVRRHDGSVRELVKNRLTQRTRSMARRGINEWLPEQIDALNREAYPHFYLLDEADLLRRRPENELGRHFYDVGLQHPAELGRATAALYLDVILAQSLLAKKKVVICDLDNTLWSGAIGEGEVIHYHDRQKTLKRLRDKGLLLAINSKNDPKNVRWDGAGLTLEDFVCCQINWTSKVQNIRRIAEELNLKTKDFLFIDDRADERAMVLETMPEVLALDAESQAVWRRLSLAADLLPEQDELDRTLAYKQRAEREQFLEDADAAAAEQRELFRRLEFRVNIRTPELRELKRVAELINRTNQFNMCASRSTLREVTDWYNSDSHKIHVVDARDKFGSMGTVCVAVTRESSDTVDIPVFVLSCRVFGFGVETALLNHLKRSAGFPGRGKQIVGRYVATAFNEPCRDTYAQHGFIQDGDAWVYRGGGAIEDPDWLTVGAETEAAA